MVILGYVAMTSLGVVLGTIGAGGSILAVPILVYLFGIAPTEATGYSLVIVGASALVAALAYLRRGLSDPGMALVFGLPSVAGVYATRRWLFPAIPDPVVDLPWLSVSKDAGVMLLFASFMFVAAYSMIRSGARLAEEYSERTPDVPLIFAAGLLVGIFTGLVGAGGGFMILPVLVLVGGLPIKTAIGTDLLVIAAKSLIGFIGEMQVAVVDWGFVGVILVLPLLGIVGGTILNHHVSPARLKLAFGWFVLLMGGYILTREILFA